MSLIIARREDNDIILAADTKLSDILGGDIGQKQNPLDGVLKTCFLNRNICVAFAGGKEFADDTFKSIGDNSTIENTIAKLLNCHINISKGKTDYIICHVNSNSKIYAIKNGMCEETNSAWIGDKIAFEKFQSYLLGGEKPLRAHGSFFNAEVKYPKDLFSDISTALDYVIQDDKVDSVGGFKTIAVLTKEKTYYNCYIKSYTGVYNLRPKIGAQIIPGHDTAEEGGYTINFLGADSSLRHVALHIKQGKFGIIYSRRNNGLPHPIMYNLDEVDFCDLLKLKYGFSGGLVTQDRFGKFMQDGIDSAKKRDFLLAITSFDKAFLAGDSKQKGNALYYKGIALINMKRNNDAEQCFIFSVKLNPDLANAIAKLKRN